MIVRVDFARKLSAFLFVPNPVTTSFSSFQSSSADIIWTQCLIGN